jgi:hypothetical protein
VTIVKNHNLDETDLINKVKQLKKTIITSSFIKRYNKKALPDLEHVDYSGNEANLNFRTLFI